MNLTLASSFHEPRDLLRGWAKRVVNSVLAPLRLEVRAQNGSPSWDHVFSMLKKYSWQPATVFDIGVGEGTPWLYEAFPQAAFYLIDPTRESLQHMQDLAKRLNAKIFNVALGDRCDVAEIDVRPEIGGSTLYQEVGFAESKDRYFVQVNTFDSLITDFQGPALCKIDVQGAELTVLKGMVEALNKIDVYIIECSTIATVRGGAEVVEVIEFMSRHDFVIYDIASMCRRPLDNGLAQMDLVFVNRNSLFRADHRWSASYI